MKTGHKLSDIGTCMSSCELLTVCVFKPKMQSQDGHWTDRQMGAVHKRFLNGGCIIMRDLYNSKSGGIFVLEWISGTSLFIVSSGDGQ